MEEILGLKLLLKMLELNLYLRSSFSICKEKTEVEIYYKVINILSKSRLSNLLENCATL